MFGINSNITVHQKGLEALMTDHPETAERLQDVIRTLLWDARQRLALDVRTMYGGDREIWRSVRNIVFKQVLGGNLNILNMKRNTAKWRIEPRAPYSPLKRGGNRRQRSFKTARAQGYEGRALGYVLRFQNQGTKERHIKYRTSPTGKKGNRGSIIGAQFFERDARKELGVMAEQLGEMIDNVMREMYQQETKNK